MRSSDKTFLDPDLARMVAGFWARAGEPPPFPRDLEGPVANFFPCVIVRLSQPTVGDVYHYLAQHGASLPSTVRGETRKLFGCLVAYAGVATIFVDGTAEESEQRFTVAHECGHLIHDYIVPRAQCIERLGDGVRDVLDGLRSATESERVDSILAGLVLGPYTDLMLRGPNNRLYSSYTSRAEQIADTLALELLAPFNAVLAASHTTSDTPTDVLRATVHEQLQATFGLPQDYADLYTSRLAKQFGYHSVKTWLGL